MYFLFLIAISHSWLNWEKTAKKALKNYFLYSSVSYVSLILTVLKSQNEWVIKPT
jgi:hypothetical protein